MSILWSTALDQYTALGTAEDAVAGVEEAVAADEALRRWHDIASGFVAARHSELLVPVPGRRSLRRPEVSCHPPRQEAVCRTFTEGSGQALGGL